MNKLSHLSLVLFILLSLLLPYNKANALGSPSQLSINDVQVFRNIWECGDWVFMVYYNLDYPGLDEAEHNGEYASNNFICSLNDPSGTRVASNRVQWFDENVVAIYVPSPFYEADSRNSVEIGLATYFEPYLNWGEEYEIKIERIYGDDEETYIIDTTLDWSPSTNYDYSDCEEDEEDTKDYCIGLMDQWLLYTFAEMESERGETLIQDSNYVINSKGKMYLDAILPGIQGVSEVLYVSQYVPNQELSDHDRDYEYSLAGDLAITHCESINFWESENGVVAKQDVLRTQGNYSISFTESSVEHYEYDTFKYDPDDYIVLGDRDLSFEMMCTSGDSYFSDVSVYIADMEGGTASWSVGSFESGIFDDFTLDIENPTSSGTSLNTEFIDYIEFRFKPKSSSAWGSETEGPTCENGARTGCKCRDETRSRLSCSDGSCQCVAFYQVYIDNIVGRGVSNVGELTDNAFDGLGEWLGVSGSIVGGMFFLFIYLITASIIFLTTTNALAAIVIAIPVIIFAGLLGIISITLITFLTFIVVLVAGYLLWVG